MMIQVLKCKLQQVIVTEASLDYQGSITIDEDLMDAAGLVEYERVEVNGKTSPSRITTYVIAGKRGSGIIGLNGGAAHHFKVGERVHILSYTSMSHQEHNVGIQQGWNFKPLIIHTDANNHKISQS